MECQLEKCLLPVTKQKQKLFKKKTKTGNVLCKKKNCDIKWQHFRIKNIPHLSGITEALARRKMKRSEFMYVAYLDRSFGDSMAINVKEKKNFFSYGYNVIIVWCGVNASDS